MRLAPLFVSLAMLMAAPLCAQAGDPTALIAEQQAAISRLQMMDGLWRGHAVTSGPGGAHKIVQTERVGSFLGGTIKLIEGRGFNPDGSTGFNAFAIVSYNAAAKAYRMQSYAQGREGSFTFSLTPTGFVWEVPAGPATIRYTAVIAGNSWTEVGERVMPDRPPMRFFEMTLTRIGDTRWPGEGAPGPQ